MRNYIRLPAQHETKNRLLHLINPGKRLPWSSPSRTQKRYG
jgi:hypothetical protein